MLRASRGKTAQVRQAIHDGNITLRSISENTGIDYRTVNAIVTNLQHQEVIKISNPFAKRGNQEFFLAGTAPKNQFECPWKGLFQFFGYPVDEHLFSGDAQVIRHAW